MSKAYVKLFQRILDSSIWDEPDPVRITWVTLLAMTDDDGVVNATMRRIAMNARVSLEDAEEAMRRFQEPDPKSLTTVEEGRRVRKVDGGWFLINYHKYRVMMDEEDRKERDRRRKALERFAAKQATEIDRERVVIRKRSRPTAAEAVAAKVLSNGGTEDEAAAAVDRMRDGVWKAGHKHNDALNADSGQPGGDAVRPADPSGGELDDEFTGEPGQNGGG